MIKLFAIMKLVISDYQLFRERFDERVINNPGSRWMIVMRLLRNLDSKMWRLRGFTEVECFGDSHLSVLRRLNGRISGVRFVVNSVRGATALGIKNPNSKSNAMEIFRPALCRQSTGKDLLFCLGEVDCGFLIWLLAKSRRCQVNEVMDEAVRNYTDFVFQHRRNRRVAILSAPLPTIADAAAIGEVANLRRDVSASLHQRTALTLEFNKRLMIWCQENQAEFIDLDRYALDHAKGVVRSDLLNSNPSDHHYDSDMYIKILKISDLSTIYSQ